MIYNRTAIYRIEPHVIRNWSHQATCAGELNVKKNKQSFKQLFYASEDFEVFYVLHINFTLLQCNQSLLYFC